MESLLDMSIIIPTRNRCNTLVETLLTLKDSNYQPKQIIIVDQSDEAIKENEIMQFVHDKVELCLVLLDTPSLTRARNIGISRATCSIILFMDDDVLLNKDSLLILAKTFQDKKVSLVAAPHYQDMNLKKYKDILGLTFFRKKLVRESGYVCRGAILGRYTPVVNDIIPTEWAMGYFFAVRKEVLQHYKISFDEKLISYAYAEDLDFTYSFCSKSKKDGYKTVLNSKIYVNHLGSKEWRVTTEKARYMYVINRVYLSYKHFKSPIYRLLLVWSDIGELFREIITKGEKAKILLKAYYLCLKNIRSLRKGVIPEQLYLLIR